MSLMVVSFFFQAEDGIRDVAVTGVQSVLFRSSPPSVILAQAVCSKPGMPDCMASCMASIAPSTSPWISRKYDILERSEERRVGKECRSRWSPHRCKDKSEGVGTRTCAHVGHLA